MRLGSIVEAGVDGSATRNVHVVCLILASVTSIPPGRAACLDARPLSFSESDRPRGRRGSLIKRPDSARSVDAAHAKLFLDRKTTLSAGEIGDWRILRSSGEARFRTPMLFASFSVSGNQWLKLLYFYREWSGWLNLLVSQADIYRCRPYLRDEITRLGLRNHLASRAEKLRKDLRARDAPASYRSYRARRGTRNGPFLGLTMLDSGGFTFGNLRRLALLRERASSPTLTATADALEKEEILEGRESWTERKALTQAEAAQVPHLRFGLAVRPDFVVALDRIIENPLLPLRVKRRRAFFSISCAAVALREVSQTRQCDSLLLPVIHPYGPAAPSDLAGFSKTELMKSYGASISWQIEKLEQVERKCGESFPGLAVGSLVPFENAVMAPLIGDAIEKCLKQSQFRGRFVHCFGANNEKLEILQSRGFQSFDTNHHAKLARSRRFYDPATKSYFGLRDKRWPRCGCVI